MARTIAKAKDPDAELAALHQKRVGLAGKRHELDAAVGAAESVVGGATGRRGVVLLAEARGETAPETLEAVELDRRKAEAVIVGARERIEALRQVEREVAAEVDAVEDAHPEFFRAKAEAKSEAAEEKRASLARDTPVVVAMGRDAAADWSRFRNSCRRRGVDPPPQVLVADLGGASSELAKSQGDSYPGGSKAALERWSVREAPKVSNAEAIRQFAGREV
jgi:hypothetical protein